MKATVLFFPATGEQMENRFCNDQRPKCQRDTDRKIFKITIDRGIGKKSFCFSSKFRRLLEQEGLRAFCELGYVDPQHH